MRRRERGEANWSVVELEEVLQKEEGKAAERWLLPLRSFAFLAASARVPPQICTAEQNGLNK